MYPYNQFDVKDKVIIVTGAAGLLGQGYTHTLCCAGAIVYAWDHKDFIPNHINATACNVEITDPQNVSDATDRIIAQHGVIDAVINNAAMNPAVGGEDQELRFAPYPSYPINLFREEMDINVTGAHIVTAAVSTHMQERRTGSIINVASEAALAAHDHRVYQKADMYKSPAYTASKTAILGLTRQWAAYLGQYNVRVNSISIGGVRHKSVPAEFAERFGSANMLGRMAKPGEYDASMIYLCSDASSFMTGSNLVIDGGKTSW